MVFKTVQWLFSSNWISKNQSEPVWTILNHFEPIWSDLIWFDLIWSDSIQFEPSWSKLIQFKPIWTNLNRFDPTWSELNWFEPNYSSKWINGLKRPTNIKWTNIFQQRNNNNNNSKQTWQMSLLKSLKNVTYFFRIIASDMEQGAGLEIVEQRQCLFYLGTKRRKMSWWWSPVLHKTNKKPIHLNLYHLRRVIKRFFYFVGIAKGQLISKCIFGVIVWTKIPTIFF